MDTKSKKRAAAPRTSTRETKRTKISSSSTPTSDRIQSPALPPSKSSTPAPQDENQPQLQTLPSSFHPKQHLPTLPSTQPPSANQPNAQWQTIEESGVMAESIERSRTRWQSEGLFQRYWTKPYKRKGVTFEPPSNPPRDSMVRSGICTIYIEPHAFQVQLYTVKDANIKQPLQSQPESVQRPAMQYGPATGWTIKQEPPLSAHSPSQSATSTMTRPVTVTHPTAPPYNPPIPSAAPTPSASLTIPAASASTAPTPIPTPSAQPTSPTPANAATPTPSASNQPTATPSRPPPPSRGSDPVIQMLAERAATNSDLKSLMRIVADGGATPEQLRAFQGHIDELTRILQTRQAANPHAIQQPIHRPPPPPAPVAKPTTPHPGPTPQAASLRSKGPPPLPSISTLAFEFVGGSGDRFLFPKYSILDFHHPCRCICSFLIVRKGTPDHAPYDPLLDYYQPITIRIEAPPNQPRILDACKAFVAPPEEVRRYMNEIMDKCQRAEYVLLAMQLPKDGEDTTPSTENNAQKDDGNRKERDNGVLWTNGTKNVLKNKEVRPELTEEDVRINYIRSVAQ